MDGCTARTFKMIEPRLSRFGHYLSSSLVGASSLVHRTNRFIECRFLGAEGGLRPENLTERAAHGLVAELEPAQFEV